MTPIIHHGDCLEVMRSLPDNSVHAIVTDPPYGLSNTTPDQVAETIVKWVSGERDYLPSGRGFMNRAWDAFVPPVAVWDEAMRVLKPGGHVLAFAGTRTMDLMTLGLRLAGFDIRDSVAWLHSQGFPKSMDVSKAIDKLNGRKFEDRYALGRHIRSQREALGLTRAEINSWFGYKDGCEHWERQDPSGARVPTLADWIVLKERLNLSEEHRDLVERVEAERKVVGRDGRKGNSSWLGTNDGQKTTWGIGEWNLTAPATEEAKKWQGWGTTLKPAFEPIAVARKPFKGTLAANVLSHATGALNVDASRSEDGRWPPNVALDEVQAKWLDEASGAGRYFYTSKASKGERPVVDGLSHPTAKPLDLMQWLVRMVTPPGGTVLEPFAGSGTTVEACILEGFDCIGIEREAEYLPLIHERIRRATEQINEAPAQGAFPLEETA